MDGLCKCGCGGKTSLWRYGPKRGVPRDYLNGHNGRGQSQFPIVDGKKTCSRCLVVKPVDEFYVRDDQGALRGPCKVCLRPQRNRATKAYYFRHHEESLARGRRRRFKDKGLDEQKWRALLEGQGGVCAVCGSSEPGKQGWHTDHDHSCCSGSRSCGECVRGLLCWGCNVGLGAFGDDPARLQAAIRYLQA